MRVGALLTIVTIAAFLGKMQFHAMIGHFGGR